MSDNGRDDEVVNEFDQTNGKVNGLEGDERERDTDDGLVGAGAVLGSAINEAAETVFGSDDEEDGRTREERDDAVTPTSEDERR